MQIADPQQSGYLIRQPILGASFNTRDYNSIQSILNDVQAVIETTLREKMDIISSDYKVDCFLLLSFMPLTEGGENRTTLLSSLSQTFMTGLMSENL